LNSRLFRRSVLVPRERTIAAFPSKADRRRGGITRRYIQVPFLLSRLRCGGRSDTAELDTKLDTILPVSKLGCTALPQIQSYQRGWSLMSLFDWNDNQRWPYA